MFSDASVLLFKYGREYILSWSCPGGEAEGTSCPCLARGIIVVYPVLDWRGYVMLWSGPGSGGTLTW